MIDMNNPYRVLLYGWLSAVMMMMCAHGVETMTLEQRLAALAQTAAREIHFVEEKHSWILAEPVISEGVLKYDAGTGVLSKQVLKPEQMSMSISGDQIKIMQAKQQRQLQIPKDSPVHDLLLALRALLAGDVAALQRNFIINYQPAETTWVVTLTPRDPVLNGKLARIEVAGKENGNQVDTIEIILANGDRQLMHLQP
jgi:hypothetical protein